MIFHCSGLELDTERFTASSDGEPVSVPPKVFDLLVFLMRNRDRLVTREELFDALWSRRVVSDNVLSNEIKQARAVLGDDGDKQAFIKTVRGRGYQFVGDVTEVDTSDEQPASPAETASAASKKGRLAERQPFLAGAVVLLTVVLGIVWLVGPTRPANEATPDSPSERFVGELSPSTVAILPFANRSDLEQDAYFVDGFHDDLITQVSQIRDLATISRTSVMTYRNSSKSTRTIAEELGSAIVIEGGVQRAGKQVRINVQMIDAAKDEHIWAETYTRELNAQNVFEIQGEIALAVATNLQAVLTQQEQQDIASIPTQNTAALEAFFRGRVSKALKTSQGYGEAIVYFQQAVDLDPEFAEAHAQLGLALLEEQNYTRIRPLEAIPDIPRAEVHINRALGLNPDLSEAYEALALLELKRGNIAEVEAAFQQAIQLKPGNADAIRMYASFKDWWLFQADEGLALLNRLNILDPQNPATLTVSSAILSRMNRTEDARTLLNVARASAPEFAETYRLLGELHHWKFYQFDEAIKSYRRYLSLDPDSARSLFDLAVAYDELGLPDEAERLYELVLERERDQDWSWLYIARIRLNLLRGEHEQAVRSFAEIEEAFSGRNLTIDIMLRGFDLEQGNPALAIERIEAISPDVVSYPETVSADPDRLLDDYLFKLAIVYATALHLTGQTEQAEPLTQVILENLPHGSRHRWRGIETLDTWLHEAMGNQEAALESLRDWRAMGGRLDLTTHRMVPASLFDSQEFQAINNEILAELEEQRANLARMDAAGELAAIPGVSLSETH